MNQSDKYSNAVRARVIETAIMLLRKAGCDAEMRADGNRCTIDVFNPPDNADRHARMLKASQGQAFSD